MYYKIKQKKRGKLRKERKNKLFFLILFVLKHIICVNAHMKQLYISCIVCNGSLTIGSTVSSGKNWWENLALYGNVLGER